MEVFMLKNMVGLVLSIFLVFTSCSHNVKPSDPSILLQFRPQRGDTYHVVTLSRQTITQTVMGRDLVNQKTLCYDFTVFVETVSSNSGERTLKVTFNKIQYDERDPDRPLFFDSEKPSPNIPLELQGYAQIIGKSFYITTALNGSILKLSDINLLTSKMLKGFEKDQKIVLSVKHLYNPVTLRETVQTFLPFFSNEKVLTNSSWSNTIERFGSFPLILNQTYTLKERKNRQAFISLYSIIKPWTAKKSVARKAPTAINYTLNYILSGTQTRNFIVNEKTGWVSEVQGDQHLLGNVQPIQGNKFQKIPKNMIWPIRIDQSFEMKSEKI